KKKGIRRARGRHFESARHLLVCRRVASTRSSTGAARSEPLVSLGSWGRCVVLGDGFDAGDGHMRSARSLNLSRFIVLGAVLANAPWALAQAPGQQPAPAAPPPATPPAPPAAKPPAPPAAKPTPATPPPAEPTPVPPPVQPQRPAQAAPLAPPPGAAEEKPPVLEEPPPPALPPRPEQPQGPISP